MRVNKAKYKYKLIYLHFSLVKGVLSGILAKGYKHGTEASTEKNKKMGYIELKAHLEIIGMNNGFLRLT